MTVIFIHTYDIYRSVSKGDPDILVLKFDFMTSATVLVRFKFN